MITEEQIWSYLDGSLSAQERRAVDEAVANHPATAELFGEILALHKLLQAVSPEKPSAAFADRVMASVSPVTELATVRASNRLIFFFSLPIILTLVICAVLVAYYRVPLTYTLPFDINLPQFKNGHIYMVVADILLLAYFVDSLSEYRFNRKALLS